MRCSFIPFVFNTEIGQPAPAIQWFIDEDLIPSDDDHYEMDYTDGHAVLHMKNVEVHDEGEYMLVASNEYGSASTSCELTVAGKCLQCSPAYSLCLHRLPVYIIALTVGEGESPSFSDHLKPISVNDGEETTLTVTYAAGPAPGVQWFHNDELIMPSVDFEIVTTDTQSTLVIGDTMPEDAGLYKVVLTNPHGEAVTAEIGRAHV